jgi:murein DD-endopeptidase MepM/ murein hydrolase activator NlpD
MDCTPTPFIAGDYALPVDQHWYDQHPDWFTKPHHDHPAADIPVPTGTPVYAPTNGIITAVKATGDCGVGIILAGNDRVQYTYCHGLPGSPTVTVGNTVHAGQQLMLSASTGNSTGPHLHFAIRVDGQERCPQNYLVAVAKGRPVDPLGLPGTGCTS